MLNVALVANVHDSMSYYQESGVYGTFLQHTLWYMLEQVGSIILSQYLSVYWPSLVNKAIKHLHPIV